LFVLISFNEDIFYEKSNRVNKLEHKASDLEHDHLMQQNFEKSGDPHEEKEEPPTPQNLNDINDQKIMKKKQIRNNRKRSKHANKERAFQMIKILGQGAFANVYLVQTKETG
jgi:hypothetical protein